MGNEYGICELAPRSAEDARSRSKSKSGSRSSSRRSSSRRSGSHSGSRSYDGHGSAELSANGIGYECETKYDCADPQICNEYGICELAPRSAEDARSRSKSKSSSRRSGSKSSSRRSGSHSGSGSRSYDGHGSAEEMVTAEEKV